MKDQEKDYLYESDTVICAKEGTIASSSVRRVKRAFERCYHSIPLEFKGKIQKKNNKYVCFEKIYISGMYSDGTMYDDKEDHVWMELTGFEQYHVGDAVSFGAEVYRYIKTSHGKSLDYGLRNPQGITKIQFYDLPSDEELRIQALEYLKCEVCDMADLCSHTFCYRRG